MNFVKRLSTVVKSSRIYFDGARIFFPKKFNGMTFTAEVRSMDHETLVQEFLKFRASTTSRLDALEKGVPVLVKNTAAELLLHSIGVQPKLHMEESILRSTQEKEREGIIQRRDC